MTAPPGHAPTTGPTPRPFGGDAHLAYMAREAQRTLGDEHVHVSRREALRIAREFADAAHLDQLDRDVRSLIDETFHGWLRSNWLKRLPVKAKASMGGWRLRS